MLYNQKIKIVKNIKFICVGLLLASISFVSCSKSAPQGPTGATGATGATGPDSVIYSNTITLQFTKQYFVTFNDSVLLDSIPVQALTSQVVASSVVIGYVYFPTGFGDSSWISDYNLNNGPLQMIQFTRTGGIDLISEEAEFPDGTSTSDLSGLKFRYVIVPGKIEVSNANGGTTTITAEEAKKMSYSDLMSALGHQKASGN